MSNELNEQVIASNNKNFNNFYCKALEYKCLDKKCFRNYCQRYHSNMIPGASDHMFSFVMNTHHLRVKSMKELSYFINRLKVNNLFF